MGLLDKLKAHLDAERTYRKVKDAEDPYNIEERQKKRDETRITRIDFTYNPTDDCYE